MPTAHGWNFLRAAERNGSWDVRKLRTLDEAVPLLTAQDDFVLGLPIAAVLAQRFHLPTVDPAEFPEMVRIQIEKALPFSADELTTDFEVIEQTETGSVVSAVAVRNDHLAEIAAPLLKRDYIPRQVTVYAAQRASTHAPQGNALLIYPEGETIVSAVTENGKVSLTRTLEGVAPQQLQIELPQLALSAELQGINASFPNVLLDETCYELRETVQGILSSPTEIVGVETPPASVKLNLLPESWRLRRSQLARRGEWRKWLIWAGAAYAGLVSRMPGLLSFGNWAARSPHRPRCAQDRIRPGRGSQLEGARARGRFALLPGRNFATSVQQSALTRGAHYCLQSVRAPNLSRRRSRFGGARLSVHRQVKKESGTANFSV
ncbi:MAG: hypothetical protein DMF17_12760 [Verrucomicrobia bacterium]|nr:MAG: hypothetical protein DMF17_12760 [Verrucomicrobiota bacterium]